MTASHLVHNWFVLRDAKNVIDLLCIEIGQPYGHHQTLVHELLHGHPCVSVVGVCVANGAIGPSWHQLHPPPGDTEEGIGAVSDLDPTEPS